MRIVFQPVAGAGADQPEPGEAVTWGPGWWGRRRVLAEAVVEAAVG